MRTLYNMEYDEKTGKIITDEYIETEHNCWSYYFSKPDVSGYGELATTREMCIKKLIGRIRGRVKELEKKLKTTNKTLKDLEEKK